MKLSEVYQIANEIAPKRISDEMCEKYGWYDNSGVLVDVGEEITGIVFSLDLTEGAIEKALQTGANLIVTHHPAIYGKISSLDYHDEGLLGKKLVTCIRNGISVLSMHLNLDAAKGGIDESLMEGVGVAAQSKPRFLAGQCVMEGGVYGRIYEVEKTKLGALVNGLEKEFSSKRVVLYGESEKTITRVASFCGSGADEKAIAFACSQGAEVMLSADFKHHVLLAALERGLSVIALTHYASENYGFQKYYEKIRSRVEIPCAYHADDFLL